MRHSLLCQLLILVLCIISHSTCSAADWQSFPFTSNYRAAQSLGGRIYMLKSNCLLQADATHWQIERELTRQDGLSGTEFVDMCYSAEADRIALVYTDGQIDLIATDGSICNIPDYYNAPMQGTDKEIVSVREQQGQLFICTAYGFVVIDLCQEVIRYNFDVNSAVRCAWQFDDGWFYSTDHGTYYSPCSSNPYKGNNWQLISDNVITQALVFRAEGEEQCWLLSSNKKIFRQTPGSPQLEECLSGSTLRCLHYVAPYVFALADNTLTLFDTRLGACPPTGQTPIARQQLTCTSGLSFSTLQSISALDNKWGLLDTAAGLTLHNLEVTSDDTFSFESDTTSPLTFQSHQQSATINRIAISPNGQLGMSHIGSLLTSYATLMGTRGYLTTYQPQTDQWSNYTASVISEAITEGQKRLVGVTNFIADPLHDNRYWFSTLEDGIVGIDNGQFLVRYNHTTTDGALQNCAYNCTRTSGLALSQQGDLWCINEGVSSLLKVHEQDNDSWHEFTLPGLESAYGFNHLIHTQHGDRHQLWGMQQFTYLKSNVFVYDYGTSITDRSDDRVVVFKELSPLHSSAVTPYYGRGICEDPNGTIYLLNTSGLFAVDNPDEVFTHPGQVRALLTDVIPTSIAFDQKQRIWVSTEADGLLLLSADGSHQLAHFTSTNSPLPVSEINSVAYDKTKTQLWIASEGLLLAYQYEDNQQGEIELSSVAYCWPSAVAQGTNDAVTLFGVKDGTTVTLTDSKGRILQQDTALGGLLSIATKSLSVGTYTLSGTDAKGVQSTLDTFDVVAE